MGNFRIYIQRNLIVYILFENNSYLTKSVAKLVNGMKVAKKEHTIELLEMVKNSSDKYLKNKGPTSPIQF